MRVTVAILVACGVRSDLAAAYLAGLVTGFGRFGVQTNEQVAGFIAEGCHESNFFTRTEENLNYSSERLMIVWPSRFPTLESTLPYAHKPEALARHVYSNGNGNGPESTADGWNFRGSGLLQVTGRANFENADRALGTNYATEPEQPRKVPTDAALISIWYWYSRGCNTLMMAAGIDAVSRKINKYQPEEQMQKRRALYTHCYDVTRQATTT